MNGDLAFMPRWNLLVLPWCQWQSAVPSVALSPDPNRDISGSCRDCAGAIGYTSWSLRPASQIQVKDNRKIPFGSILSLWPALEILWESPSWNLPLYVMGKMEMTLFLRASQVVLMVKNPPAKPGDIKDEVWSLGVGKANLLQYSCLKSPMDRGAWWTTVHGVTKESDTI